MTATYRHIRFEEIQGFTVCRSTHDARVALGSVEWNWRLREHDYIPEHGTAYTVECLRDIADFFIIFLKTDLSIFSQSCLSQFKIKSKGLNSSPVCAFAKRFQGQTS